MDAARRLACEGAPGRLTDEPADLPRSHRQPGLASPRVMFLALGRRGALCRLALQMAKAASEVPDLTATFVISRASELAAEFDFLGRSLLAVETFDGRVPLRLAQSFLATRRQLAARLALDQPHAVINLMPHVWTPLLARTVRAYNVPFATIIHDAVAHPGDRTALLTPWLLQEAHCADRVITLSRQVGRLLAQLGAAPERKIAPLFLPDLEYGGRGDPARRRPHVPLRLLFFGRLLKYKGLPLLLDALDLLWKEGLRVHLGVAGSGELKHETKRLSALGAEVINRWLDDAEVGPLFARYDALVLSHLECSQSGTAAIALASGMPVIGVPVGGIPEQVHDGRTGIIASDACAPALADAISRLARDNRLYESLCAGILETADDRSTRRFLSELLSAVLPG